MTGPSESKTNPRAEKREAQATKTNDSLKNLQSALNDQLRFFDETTLPRLCESETCRDRFRENIVDALSTWSNGKVEVDDQSIEFDNFRKDVVAYMDRLIARNTPVRIRPHSYDARKKDDTQMCSERHREDDISGMSVEAQEALLDFITIVNNTLLESDETIRL